MRAATGADASRKLGREVRPDHRAPTIALAECVDADLGAGIDGDGVGTGEHARAGEIASDADQPAAAIAAGVDLGPGERDLRAGDVDASAGGALLRAQRAGDRLGADPRRAGGDTAAHPDRAASAAAQHHGAVAHRDRARLGHAREVDGVARGVARGGGLHLDQPPIRRDPTRVGDQCVGIAVILGGQGDLQETVARDIERHQLARG